MKRVSSTAVAELDAMDRRFNADSQSEDPYNTAMARASHPLAGPYSRLRAFYDSLDHACNSGARMFSYASEHEHSVYWAPRLLLGAGPLAAAFARFGKVGPGHPRWAYWPSPTTTDTSDRYDVPIGGITWHVKDGYFQRSSSARQSSW